MTAARLKTDLWVAALLRRWNHHTAVVATLVLVLATVALARVASAQQPTREAICTPVVPTSIDPVPATLAIEGAINAHLAAGRTTIEIQPLPPAPGLYVCGW